MRRALFVTIGQLLEVKQHPKENTKLHCAELTPTLSPFELHPVSFYLTGPPERQRISKTVADLLGSTTFKFEGILVNGNSF
jgi:hypothetical protein